MYVKDLMTANPICLDENDSIMDVYNIMQEKDFHRLPITRNGKMVGLITGSTLAEYSPSKATTLSMYEINSYLSNTKCSEIMNKDVITIDEDALLEEAADKMNKHRINCLPVMRNGELVGIITQKAIFTGFIELMGYYVKGSRIVLEIEEDVPGVLEKVSGVLAKENVSISHLAVYRRDGIYVVVRTYDEDADKVAKLLEGKGYKVVDSRVNK